MKTKNVLFAAVLAACTMGGLAAAGEDLRQITVTGEGQLAVAPDQAVITLGVTKEASEADAAMAAVSKEMSAVVAALRGAGIDPADLQTRQVLLQPIWSKTGSLVSGTAHKITGFSASNNLALKVRNLDQLGPVLDLVLKAGANQFQGLSFGVADLEEVKDQMRDAAVADGIRKARQLAKAAQMILGPVRMISDHDQGGGRPMMAMEMARSSAMPIEAGELNYSHSVQMVFDLLVPEAE